MARVLLQLGSRKDRLVAKRIGQRLLLLSQGRRPPRAQEILVHELLGDIGELPLPENREKNWASRIRESVERALELLITHGVLKAVEWPDGFGPGNIDRSKGWSDQWLNSRIRFTATANRRAESDSAPVFGSHRKRMGRAAGLGLVGTDIRFARTNIVPHWTQDGLARQLRISRRHLSQIETGKRRPSPVLAERLQDWLDSRKKEGQSEFGFDHKRDERGGSYAAVEVEDNAVDAGPQRDGSAFQQKSPAAASPNSGAERALETPETTDVVRGRGATRQGTGVPVRRIRTRTGHL